MPQTDEKHLEERVLLLAPTAKDTEICAQILAAAGVACTPCTSLEELCFEMERGGGAAILTQESILVHGPRRLARALAEQPPWSDFPLVVLTTGGNVSSQAVRELESVGHMTLMKRPVQIADLVSTLHAVLRDRRRQRQTRDYLIERERAEEAAHARTRQLQHLAEIFLRLNAAHDVHSVLGVMTEEARNLIGAHQAVARLTTNSSLPMAKTCVSLSAQYQQRLGNNDADLLPEMSNFPYDLDRAVRMTRAENEAWQSETGDPEDTKSLSGSLTVPLFAHGGRRWGFLRLSDKYEGDFTENDEALVVQLAQMASTAFENARLYDELREKDRRKDEFLAMLAHELRNPLSAVDHAVHVTTVSRSAEHIDWCMDVVSRQAKHLSRLIDDLLDVSRITRGKIQLRKAQLDPYRVLYLAIEAVRPLIDQRGHDLTLSFGPPAPIEADPTRLEQILVNLITNAAKYTEEGGHIKLSAGVEGSEFVIKVRDNGVGIAPAMVSQMFELFAQGDRSLARSEGGLGIGLTLARSLAEMHGGSLTALSEGPGKGSEFVVRLPAEASSTNENEEGETLSPMAKNRCSRILVVDDNVDTARGMEILLKLHGHDVHAANDGRAALQAAEALRPDVVLLDIGLPGMDGYQVAAKLREDQNLKGTVIIAVSGYAQEEDRRRSRAAGFDHHMVKPVDHKALMRLLATSETA